MKRFQIYAIIQDTEILFLQALGHCNLWVIRNYFLMRAEECSAGLNALFSLAAFTDTSLIIMWSWSSVTEVSECLQKLYLEHCCIQLTYMPRQVQTSAYTIKAVWGKGDSKVCRCVCFFLCFSRVLVRYQDAWCVHTRQLSLITRNDQYHSFPINQTPGNAEARETI